MGGYTLLLAGCGQNEPNIASQQTDTAAKQETARPNLINQSFRFPVEQNPARISFHGTGIARLESTFAISPKKQASGRLRWMIREPGVWFDKRFVGSTAHYTWLEDITIAPTQVTFSIREDATWSDGQPITGKDIAVNTVAGYLRHTIPPYFAAEEKEEPTHIRDAIDGFEITDKSVTYQSSPGYFDKWWDWTIITALGVGRRLGSNAVPTHIEPYGDYADAVFTTARRAQQGAINPWEGWEDPYTRPEAPHKESLDDKYLAKGGKFVEKFSNPENVVSTSVWDLVEINGPEAVLEPNPHHRNAQGVNFKRVILEHTASDKRVRAALNAGRLDYAAPGPTPQAVVDSLPDPITQLQIPGGPGSGNELKLNFNHPAMGEQKVRQAIMYALDQSTIANNIHQTAALPVITPGGDSWNATDYASAEWIDKNLITYTQDPDLASSLMIEAGYSRDGDEWLNPDGKPFTLTLPTPNKTPRWEPTVASQLSKFGIQTSVQTLDGSAFSKRVRNGEFPMWAGSGAATSTAVNALDYWRYVPVYPKRYGIYPKEQFETGTFSVNGAPVPRTEERYSVFTIEAPPIGRPNGPFQKYHPSTLALFFFTSPPKPEFHRRVKTGMWLANWFLPTIPINKTTEQHFIDDVHWSWPKETPEWRTYKSSGPVSIEGIFANGEVYANPDNPEQT